MLMLLLSSSAVSSFSSSSSFLPLQHHTYSTFTKPNIISLPPLILRCSSKQQQQQQQQQTASSSSSKSKKNKKKKSSNGGGGGGGGGGVGGGGVSKFKKETTLMLSTAISPVELDRKRNPDDFPSLPKPPAGFILDDEGRVVMVSDRRLATIVDSATNQPLDCVIRRVFISSHGDECLLLCPVDTPVQIMKSANFEGWDALTDVEAENIIPSVAYALAKIHMHLVPSGFCYTARGGFCYSEDDVFELDPDDGQEIEGVPSEGIEITSFHQDGVHFMLYTPCDPLLFIAVKDKEGTLKLADDDLLEDPATINAIDEETEFNALVEAESELLDSLLGRE